ncbi:MAG: hypothetical protein E7160_03590 [Firmicutes bacterium]|nr:hypothetical protein [Bacillota bacterium]
MNKKIIKSLVFVSALTLVLTGCGKKAELKGGNKTAVKIGSTEISATDYYNQIKKANISKLIDMVDHQILDKKYKTDEKEKKEINTQIKQIKSTYQDDETYLNVIKQYFGVNSEDELKSMLSLEYKRKLAVEDYVKDSIKDDEIKKYYNDKITGEMKASHILIKVKSKENATDEEKKKADSEAKKKAEDIIKKLNKGEKFEKLAKKYSEDDTTKNDGGDLGYFSNDDMVEEFTNAAKKLEKNKYTKEPVKTEYGYHIILKTDQKKKPSLKSVKKEIKEKLTEEKLTDSTIHYTALMEIREKNHITWNDSELKKEYKKYMEQIIDNIKKQNESTTK